MEKGGRVSREEDPFCVCLSLSAKAKNGVGRGRIRLLVQLFSPIGVLLNEVTLLKLQKKMTNFAI